MLSFANIVKMSETVFPGMNVSEEELVGARRLAAGLFGEEDLEPLAQRIVAALEAGESPSFSDEERKKLIGAANWQVPTLARKGTILTAAQEIRAVAPEHPEEWLLSLATVLPDMIQEEKELFLGEWDSGLELFLAEWDSGLYDDTAITALATGEESEE